MGKKVLFAILTMLVLIHAVAAQEMLLPFEEAVGPYTVHATVFADSDKTISIELFFEDELGQRPASSPVSIRTYNPGGANVIDETTSTNTNGEVIVQGFAAKKFGAHIVVVSIWHNEAWHSVNLPFYFSSPNRLTYDDHQTSRWASILPWFVIIVIGVIVAALGGKQVANKQPKLGADEVPTAPGEVEKKKATKKKSKKKAAKKAKKKAKKKSGKSNEPKDDVEKALDAAMEHAPND